MSRRYLNGAIGWALMAALVLGSGTMACAQSEEGTGNDTEGVVKIGRSDKDAAKPNLPAPANHNQPQAPKYWVGLLVGDIPAEHVLRAQLDLPENQGLLVANVLGNSPAAKAGLKQHDILLKANGHDLHENTDLVDLVNSEGAKKGQITVEFLRHNKRQTVVLKPEERPANAPGPADDEVGGANGAFGPAAPGFAAPGIPDDLMRQFRERMQQMPFEFREMGPGVIVGGGGMGFGSLPNGVSITMQKENDKPVHVTISRNGQSWTVTGDDPESLKKVPEDLRPLAEQMLHGGGPIHFNMRGMGVDGGPAGPNVDAGRIRDRLDRMEKRLEEMQKRFHDQQNSPTDKNDDHNPSK